MKTCISKCLLSSLLISISFFSSAEDPFPHRDEFSDVPVMEMSEFKRNFAKLFIVDVRSNLEFDVLHIIGATHLPMSNSMFVKSVRKLRPTGATIVTYCNGHACKKSYQAARRLIRAGIENVVAFDAGIFEWIQAAPGMAVLLGKATFDLNEIIQDSDLQKRFLPREQFLADAMTKNSLLIDVREPIQRQETKPLIGSRQIPIDKFKKVLTSEHLKNRDLYIVDAVGKQVRWLQYYLEMIGYDNYHFLQGGAENL